MSSLSQTTDDHVSDREPPPPPPSAERKPGLGTALKRYPMILLLPVIVLVAAGVTLAVRRHPTYTASTQFNVGVTDANSVATPGFAEAAQQLASSYSRQATSDKVASVVARRLNTTQANVTAHLSSPAVPNSPTFYVNATGSSAATAERLARTAGQVLQEQADAAKRNTGAGRMLSQYRTLQSRANDLAQTSGRLKGRLIGQQASVAAGGPPQVTTTGTTTSAGVATTTTSTLPTVTQGQVARARLAAQTAQLQAQAQSQRYSTAVAQTQATNLQILNPAAGASSDKRTYIERFGIIGLVAGLAIGAALAFLVARLRSRRRLA